MDCLLTELFCYLTRNQSCSLIVIPLAGCYDHKIPGTVWRDFVCGANMWGRGEGGEGISNRSLFLSLHLNSYGKTYLHFSFPSSRRCLRPSVKLTWPPTSVKQSTSDRRSSVESEYHGLRLFLPRRGYPITMLTVDRHLTLRRMKSNSGLSIFYL